MVTCRYWQQGNCRFGAQCRFEHSSQNSSLSYQNQSRFDPQHNIASGNMASRNTSGNSGANPNPNHKFSISADTIHKDLTEELPQWILSCYAPGKEAPEQLFGGFPREQSFEEMRLHHRQGVLAGNEQAALNDIQAIYEAARAQHQTILSDLDGAVSFLANSDSRHPNRIDICNQAGPGTGLFAVGNRVNPAAAGQLANNPFSGTMATPFGQPSGFGAPGFGQPSQPQSIFGQQHQQQQQQQQSSFGQGATAFGQPQQQQPLFGQPSAGGGVFGKPVGAAAVGQQSSGMPAFGQQQQQQQSAFGRPAQPAFGQTGFGQPSAVMAAVPNPLSQTSTFGNTTQMGGPRPNPFSAFAASSSNNANTVNVNPLAQAQVAGNSTANPFGQAANPAGTTPNPFAQPGGGGAANAANSASPFAQALNANTQSPSPFGQPVNNTTSTSTPNPFGHASINTAAALAPPNPFAQTANTTHTQSPFATQQQQQQRQQSAFGQAQAQNPDAAPASGTGAVNGPYPAGTQRQHPPLQSYSQRLPDGALQSWKGRSVVYRDNIPGFQDPLGRWIRIWFPNGPPDYSAETELPNEAYGAVDAEKWNEFTRQGRFTTGMPDLPPKRDYCLWDF